MVQTLKLARKGTYKSNLNVSLFKYNGFVSYNGNKNFKTKFIILAGKRLITRIRQHVQWYAPIKITGKKPIILS